MALGLESVYGDNEMGSDGLTKRERKFKEDSIAFDKMMDEMMLKQIASVSLADFNDREEFEEPIMRGVRLSRSKERRVNLNASSRPTSSASTIRSRDAASALSWTKPSTVRTRPTSVRLPKPRMTSPLFSSKRTRAPTNPSTMRHTAAVASSKTTLGYSRGRSVSNALRGMAPQPKKQTTSKDILSPETYMELYGPPPFGSNMWIRCKTAGCFDEESNQDDGSDEALPTFGEDEEAQNFQLTL